MTIIDLVRLFMQVLVVKLSFWLKMVNGRSINRFILMLVSKCKIVYPMRYYFITFLGVFYQHSESMLHILNSTVFCGCGGWFRESEESEVFNFEDAYGHNSDNI